MLGFAYTRAMLWVVPKVIFLTDGIHLLVQCFLKYIYAACASSGIYGSQGEEQETMGSGNWERIQEGEGRTSWCRVN